MRSVFNEPETAASGGLFGRVMRARNRISGLHRRKLPVFLGVLIVCAWTAHFVSVGKFASSIRPVPSESGKLANAVPENTIRSPALLRRDLTPLEELDVKIFVYPLPQEYNDALLDASRQTNSRQICVCCTVFYGSEVAFHKTLLESPYVTKDPSEADFFYVPAYVSCLIKNGARIEGVNMPDLRQTSAFLERALNYIRSNYPYWDWRGGEDHIWAFTQGYGAHLFGDYSKIRRSIFLVTNGQYSEMVYNPWKDIVIPGIHRAPPVFTAGGPGVPDSVANAEPVFHNKKHLAFWGGTIVNDTRYSSGVRQYISKHFSDEPGFRIQVSSGKWGDIFTPMHESVFCLCPEGWWAWTPRPYEAILSGCIPVLLSDDLEYPFERFVDWQKISIKISPQRIADVPSILRSISTEQISAIQANIVRSWQYFHFTEKYESGYATDMILRELAKKKVAHMPHAGNRLTRREYEDEWGFNTARTTENGANVQRRGAFQDRIPVSSIMRSKTDCDPTDPLRVKVRKSKPPTTDRTHCHGVSTLEGSRECTRPQNFGNLLVPGANTYILLDPYDHTFEIVPGAIVSTEGITLRAMESSAMRASSITVAVQASVDRVFMHLAKLAEVWKGPISLAILVDNPENDETAVRNLVKTNSVLQKWVDFHFVRRRRPMSNIGQVTYYPINMLRNVATQQVKSDWIMVLDLDVLPNSCMSAFMEQVRLAETSYASAYSTGTCPGLMAYVPPALELPENASLPTDGLVSDMGKTCTLLTKPAAVNALREGGLRPMHMYFNPAYMPTNHSRWMVTNGFFEVDYSVRFEPYYIARSNIPLFNDSFVDRGGNFAQQVYHMFAAGYRFIILPDVFTIDIPHSVASRASGFQKSLSLWEDFVAYTSELYGVSQVNGVARGPEYNAMKARLALEVLKFPAAAYDKEVTKSLFGAPTTLQEGRLSGRSKDPAQFVLVTITYQRTDLVKAILEHYCSSPSLWGIVIVWNNVGEPVPREQDFIPRCRKPIFFRPQGTNLIANRYRLSNLPPDAPDAVFLIDDDLIFSTDAVEFAFRTWATHQDQIVGFIPRSAKQKAGGVWEYGVQPEVDSDHEYHFILLGASFIHKKHFSTYWRSPEEIISLVNSVMNCDDLAMNFAVAAETGLPPIWVDAQYSRRSATGQFQANVDHFKIRSDCIGQFVRIYNGSPLVPGDIVVRPVGKNFNRPMPHVN